jgi:sugar diacid utilization regulator
MNQIDMKEAVKSAILQHDHVLMNLTIIILSMAKNHDSLCSFPVRCLAAEILSVEVKTKGEDANVTRDTRHVNLEQSYRTREFANRSSFGHQRRFYEEHILRLHLDEATAKTKNRHVIQYISYWKYKDDPNWWTHSLLWRVMEKTNTGFCWVSRSVIPLEVTMTVSAGGPIFCFVVLLKSLCL